MRNFKNKLLLLFFITAASLYAQSDYELVQQFKAKYNEIEDSIKYASSLEECTRTGYQISNIRYSFDEHQALLDKSLYPDNFNSSLEKLTAMLELRKKDFTQITQLREEVDTLKVKLSTLDKNNSELLAKILALEENQSKNTKTIASLNNLISQLKTNIKLRDQLIVDVADSLLSEYVTNPFTLTDVEKMNLAQKVQYHNLFYNMEKTIDDHIKFLNISSIEPQDVSDMKKEYYGFSKMWEKVGEKLADIYLVKNEKAEKVVRINNKFAEWDSTLNSAMWAAVYRPFKEKNIPIHEYADGEQFTNSVTDFINNEIEKADENNSDQLENTYYTFTDSVWYNKIEPQWVPILIEHKMLTKADKDTIEKRITLWKAQVIKEGLDWWVYALIAFVLVAFIIAGKFMKHPSQET